MGAMKRPSSAAGRKPAKAAKASPPPAKKTKTEPLQKDFNQLSKGLALDSELPFDVKEMLQGMMQSCFSSFKEDRHKYETSVIEMIEGVLSGVERGMVAETHALEKQIAGLGDERTKRESALKEADDSKAAQDREKDTKKVALSETAKAFQEAKQGLAAAKQEQAEGDKELVRVEGRMEQLRGCLLEQLEPLVAGSVPPGEMKKAVSGLVQILATFDYDQSLVTSIPASISKPAAERGTFDATVVTQVQTETSKRLAEFQRVLQEGGPYKAARAAKVEQAEQTMFDARDKQSAAADAFSAAEAAVKTAQTEQEQRACELQSLDPESDKLKKRLEVLFKKLTAFREGPLETLRKLTDRTAVQPPKEESPTPTNEAPQAATE